MATFPALCYFTIGYSVGPEVIRTQTYTASTRQRFMRLKRDDLFNVTLRLDATDFATFDAFIVTDINNGADTFTGPYYDGDVERTGTLEIVDGTYAVNLLQPDLWEVSYSFEVKERDMTEADNTYAIVVEVGGFDEINALFNALEITVNENELNA